jgi:hypothetical protein
MQTATGPTSANADQAANTSTAPATYRLCLECARNFSEIIAMQYALQRGAKCDKCETTSVFVAVFVASSERGKIR